MVKPYIYADITSIERTASAIGWCLKDYSRLFGEMNDSLHSMSSSWVSNDYTRFMQQWKLFYRGNSIGVGMRRDLYHYKAYLEYAASQYKKCQNNAYDRASKLK